MKCTVFCTGTLKEPYWRDAEREYIKRMSRFGGWQVVELPEAPLPEAPSQKMIEAALEKEGAAILKRLPAQSYAIALCVEGKTCSSEELAALIARLPQEGKSEIALAIGSSYGLSPRVKSACALRLSLSPMTFPHQIMRILLAEQFYRAHKIIANERYHK